MLSLRAPHVYITCATLVRRLQRSRDVLQLTDQLTALFRYPVEGQPFTQCACEEAVPGF
jgi:hypothetical protein